MMPTKELFLKSQSLHPKVPRHHLRVLMGFLLDQPPEFFIQHPELEVGEETSGDFLKLVADLAAGKPLSRILGQREFWGLSFMLSEETLDPRPDTETLIETILTLFPDRDAPLRILDLGTGTGCLIISLLTEYQNAEGVAVDQSTDALTTAQMNAQNNRVDDRLSCVKSHWFDGVEGPFDLIVSNPPYIPEADYQTLDKNVKDYDPKAALVGGVDGLTDYRMIIQKAPHFLKKQGVLVFEVGQGQHEPVGQLLKNQNFKALHFFKDLAGINRCVSAQKSADIPFQ